MESSEYKKYRPLVSVPLEDMGDLLEPQDDAPSALFAVDGAERRDVGFMAGHGHEAGTELSASSTPHADPAMFTEQLQRLRARLQSVVQGVREVAQSLDEPHSLIANVREQLQSRADSSRRNSVSSAGAAGAAAPSASDGGAAGAALGSGPGGLSVKARVAAVEAVSRPAANSGAEALLASRAGGSLERRSVNLERRSTGVTGAAPAQVTPPTTTQTTMAPATVASAAASAPAVATTASAPTAGAEVTGTLGVERERRERGREPDAAAAGEDVQLWKRRRSGTGGDAAAPAAASAYGSAKGAAAAASGASSESGQEPQATPARSGNPRKSSADGGGAAAAIDATEDSGPGPSLGRASSGTYGGSGLGAFRTPSLQRSSGQFAGRPPLSGANSVPNGAAIQQAPLTEADGGATGPSLAAANAGGGGGGAPADFTRTSSSGRSSMYAAAAAAVAAADVAAADVAAALGGGDSGLSAATANAAAAVAYLEAHPETLRELWTLRARVRWQEGELASMVKQLSSKNAQLDAAQTSVQVKERELTDLTRRLTSVLSRLQTFQAMHQHQHQELLALQLQQQQQAQAQQELQERELGTEREATGVTRGSIPGASAAPHTPPTPRAGSGSGIVAHAIDVSAEPLDTAAAARGGLSTVDELGPAEESVGSSAGDVAVAGRSEVTGDASEAPGPAEASGGAATPRAALWSQARATGASLDVSLPPPPSVCVGEGSPSRGSAEASEQQLLQQQQQEVAEQQQEQQQETQERQQQEKDEEQQTSQDAEAAVQAQSSLREEREVDAQAHVTEQVTERAAEEQVGGEQGQDQVSVRERQPLEGKPTQAAEQQHPPQQAQEQEEQSSEEGPGQGSGERERPGHHVEVAEIAPSSSQVADAISADIQADDDADITTAAASSPATPPLLAPSSGSALHPHASLLASITQTAAPACALRPDTSGLSEGAQRSRQHQHKHQQQQRQQAHFRHNLWGLLLHLGPSLACVALLLRDAGVRRRLAQLRHGGGGADGGSAARQPPPAPAAPAAAALPRRRRVAAVATEPAAPKPAAAPQAPQVVRARPPTGGKTPPPSAAKASGGENGMVESAASRECKAKWCKVIRPPPASAIYY